MYSDPSGQKNSFEVVFNPLTAKDFFLNDGFSPTSVLTLKRDF